MQLISTAIGLTFAIGTLVGGFLGPAIAGWSADHWGLHSSLLLDAACALALTAVSMGLRETKPIAERFGRFDHGQV
jgi:MFS family permease